MQHERYTLRWDWSDRAKTGRAYVRHRIRDVVTECNDHVSDIHCLRMTCDKYENAMRWRWVFKVDSAWREPSVKYIK